MNLNAQYVELVSEQYDVEQKLAILNRQLRPLRQERHRALLENKEYVSEKLDSGEKLATYYRNKLAALVKSSNLLKKAINREHGEVFAQCFVDVAHQHLDVTTFERLKRFAKARMNSKQGAGK
jgi:hypothetical protein